MRNRFGDLRRDRRRVLLGDGDGGGTLSFIGVRVGIRVRVLGGGVSLRVALEEVLDPELRGLRLLNCLIRFL